LLPPIKVRDWTTSKAGQGLLAVSHVPWQIPTFLAENIENPPWSHVRPSTHPAKDALKANMADDDDLGHAS
jgi:hypothetical protein